MLKYTTQTIRFKSPKRGRPRSHLPLHQCEMVKNGLEIWKIEGSNTALPYSTCVILGGFINFSEPLSSQPKMGITPPTQHGCQEMTTEYL